MAVTTAGRKLTLQFRVGQMGVRSKMLVNLLKLWPLLDVRRLDATAPEWLRLSTLTIAEHRRESARLAAAYYEQLRAAELPDEEPYRARWLDSVPETAADDAIRQSLIVTGPVSVKKASARLAGLAELGESEVAERKLEKIRETALTQVEGAAVRHVLDGGRELLREEATQDRVALAFARVSDGNPCYFCALMISRGFVFRTEDAAGRRANTATKSRRGPREAFVGDGLYKFHDHCACTVEPLFTQDTPAPDQAKKYAEIYRDATARKSGPAALTAFRAAYDAQRS